jgi:uncharacterized protein YodC (DUF2158 family)
MAAFNEGDVVTLRSGGPHMTVHTPTNETDEVTCAYFVDTEIKYISLRPGILMPVPEEIQ